MSRKFHQIWNGKSEELCKKIKPNTVDLIVTDPPYGSANKSNQAVTEAGRANARVIANDETPEIAVACFKRVMQTLLPLCKKEADCYIFTSYQVLQPWLAMTDEFMPQFDFYRKAVITWEKDGPGMGDGNSPWGMGCEFILFFQRGAREKSVKRRNSVLHISQVRPDNLKHPHEKPLQLLETLIKASSNEGDFVVDPFCGSGSTVLAARGCNRNAVGIEYDEHNFKIAKNWLESDSGGFNF